MTIKQSKVPAIPVVPPSAPPELVMFLNNVKSAIDVMAGDTSASGVTLEQLDEILRQYTITGGAAYGGIIPQPDSGGGGLFPVGPVDPTTPPAPSGLTATGGLSTVILEWSSLPSSPPIAFTTIYRAAVDNFSLAEPVGTTNVLIYADYVPDIDPYYYWITFTSEAGIEGPVNATAGVVGQADPDATGKITVAALSALTANLGTLTAGKLQSPDVTFIIDLTAKEILITGPNGQAADDYTLIRNGQIEAWYWTGSTHALAGALQGIESGIANNGDVVALTNYFRKQPNIIVSPANVPTYLTANQAQDQTLQCIAQNIVEPVPGSGFWEFTAVIQLILSSGSDVQTPGLSFSNSPVDDIYLGPVTTTNPSVVGIQTRTSVRTYRPTGVAGEFYNRQVTVYLEYRIAGSGGTWVIGNIVIQQINQETSYVVINLDTGTIPIGQYEVRLRYVFANTTGVYTGVGGGTQPADPVTRTGLSLDLTRTASNGFSGFFSGSIATDPWTPPAGAVNIRTDYSFNYTATAESEYLFAVGPNLSIVNGTGGSTTQQLAFSTIDAANPETNPKTVVKNGVFTASLSGSYDENFLGWSMNLSVQSDGEARGRIQASNVTATINYNEPIPADDISHNFAVWETLVSTISGSVVLSDGTVNWQAIGVN